MAQREVDYVKLSIARVEGEQEGKFVRIQVRDERSIISHVEVDLEGWARACFGEAEVPAFLIRRLNK